MSRYYFDITDDDGTTTDEIGSELPNFDRARSQAMLSLGEMIKDFRMNVGVRSLLSITIRDDRTALISIEMQVEAKSVRGE